MKGLKIFAAGAVLASCLASCVGDGNGQSGFLPYSYPRTVYANTQKGRLYFASYGNWTLSLTDGSWLTPSATSGRAMTIYDLRLALQPNTTHAMRSTDIILQDTDESDGRFKFTVSQYGTRGDGSWGDAALVKSVKGDDGSEITLAYDDTNRPTSLKIADKDGKTLRNLTFAWADSVVTVGGDVEYAASYNIGYQMPESVEAAGDTLTLSYGADVATLSFDCQLVESRADGDYLGQSALFKGQLPKFPVGYYSGGNYIYNEKWADEDHKADSVKYLHHYSDGSMLREYLEATYSTTDNRYQSVDANQLLLGVEECNPYLLLGLYRTLRSSAVIAEAKDAAGKYVVATTLNADRSINTMSVTDKEGRTVVYTFGY